MIKHIPIIQFCDELPQWIISSDIAAYSPDKNTIYIRRHLKIYELFNVIVHELKHWAGFHGGECLK